MATDVVTIPNDNNAEEALLGALLIDGDIIQTVYNIVKQQDFYWDSNRDVYAACVELYKRREAINQVTVSHELARVKKLESCGGTAHLSYLISICPTSLDAEYYADIIRRTSVSRQLMKAGQKIMSIGSEDDPDVDNAIARAMATMDSIKKAAVSKKLVTPRDAADAALSLLDTYNKPQQVILSGYYDLDGVTTGFRKGELTIIGARPSVGKSQLMFDISENVCSSSKVMFISAEMTLQQVMERKAARYLEIPVRQLRKGELNGEQQKKLVELACVMSEKNIHYVLESVGTNDIERELNVMLNTTGCDIVFVDYLQFLTDCRQQGENQNIRVGRAMKALKSMVMRYEIPFIVASQLSRGLETRENKRPTLSDLRDSGEIEQDADNVLLLYRGIDEPQYLEIYQAKNRQIGSQPAIRLLFHNERYVNAR